MTEEGGTIRQDGQRFTDVTKEPDKPLPPFQKSTSQPVSKLEDAGKSVQKLVVDLEENVRLSLNKCKHPKDGLTQNESAALYLYSLQWPKGKHSFYTMFNRALRSEDRTKLIPYNSYLHLFMTALEKLPSAKCHVWRGFNGNFGEQYKPQSVHYWWGASSCSHDLDVAASFLDKNDDQTMFKIECNDGKSIKNHSAFPKESEIVLPPGTCLRVKSIWKSSPQAHLIDMEQIPYEEPSTETAASSDEHHICLIWLDASVNKSQENIETQEQLRQLNVSFKTFDKSDSCRSFIDQSAISSRIILIVGGQMGREFVSKLHDHSQLTTIFVFCMNKVDNEKWAQNHTKVKAVITRQKKLVEQVRQEIDTQVEQEQLKKKLAAEVPQKQKAATAQDQPSRFTDVCMEPQEMMCPLEGYQRMSLVPLEEAIQPLRPILSEEVNAMAYRAKNNCKDPGEGLSGDEAAAIQIYTMEWERSDRSLYFILNYTLRLGERLKLKPWFLYMKLIMTALYKLPSFRGTVWRGVRDELHNKYQQGATYTWWAFSTTTTDATVLQSEQYLGQHGARTLFTIQCYNGKSIRHHSYFPQEEEILLMPGFHFRVLNQVYLGNGLYMINIQEIEPPFPLVPPPF